MATTGVFNGTKILFQISTDGGGSFTTVGHSSGDTYSIILELVKDYG